MIELLDVTSRRGMEGVMKLILKLFLRFIIFIVGIPITILYFALAFFGSIITGLGYIAGVFIFGLTLVFWAGGQFDVWYQVLVGFGLAFGIIFAPMWITESGGEALLTLKGHLDNLVI